MLIYNKDEKVLINSDQVKCFRVARDIGLHRDGWALLADDILLCRGSLFMCQGEMEIIIGRISIGESYYQIL